MTYLLLGLPTLFAVVLLLRIYASASPASLTRAVRRTAIVSAILGTLLLLLRLPLGFMFFGLGCDPALDAAVARVVARLRRTAEPAAREEFAHRHQVSPHGARPRQRRA